ncbi:MAG: prepilin-type N-terminal cleavage/methylation domain-containing protein [Deltaproteobacteria bacterium]|jgi:prepilin-type N-terminal cleavage/methylation domain-containing protein|nr:prepilin-type N-terminal cleavage/methylation domain-containing protein [Deltaproteobacteria bacterium]
MPKTPIVKNLKPGFSLLELLVIVVILGIIVLIAVPSYKNFVPQSEVRADANAVRQLFQKARLSASAIQRPVRVLLDCTEETIKSGANPCRLEAQVPIFNSNGTIKSWNKLPGAQVNLHKGTEITYESQSNLKKARFDSYALLFNNFLPKSGGLPRTYGVYGKDGFNNDSFSVVFTPSGEAVTYCPLIMRFAHKSAGPKFNMLLTLVNSTGHVRLIEAPPIA